MVFGKCWHSHGKPLSSYKMDVRFVSSEPKNVNTKKFLKKLNTLGEVDIPYRRVVQQPQEKVQKPQYISAENLELQKFLSFMTLSVN